MQIIPTEKMPGNLPETVYRYGGARSSGDELAVLIGDRHLGDADPPPAFEHPALGD